MLSTLQIAGMFAITMVGWLLFRETDLAALVRDFRLAPWHSSAFDRQAGLYLFLLSFGYSIPLWVQSVWIESGRAGVNAGLGQVPGMSKVINVDLNGRCTSSGSQRRKSELPQMRNRCTNRPSASVLYPWIVPSAMTFEVPEGKW